MCKSNNYQDYVFRNGKFLGEFEEMYKNSSTTPWHQDEQTCWVDVRLTKEMLADIQRFDRVFEFGSGTGHYLELICEATLAAGGRAHGFDISQTACKKAASLFPNFLFSVLDISREIPENHFLHTEKRSLGQRNLWVMRGTLWYVVEQIETVLQNFSRLMCDEDRLLIVQNFPPSDGEFVGKNIIPNHVALLNVMCDKFCLQRSFWYEDRLKLVNDNWFSGIFSARS